jgi:hypothetical protein
LHGTGTWKSRQPNVNRNYEEAEEYDVRDVTVGDRYMKRHHIEKRVLCCNLKYRTERKKERKEKDNL